MKTRQYLIAGAGGFGRELACWIIRSNGIASLAGFLDDTDPVLPPGYPPVIGTTENPPADLNAYDLLISIGDPVGRESVAMRLSKKGASFGLFIDRSAAIAHTAGLASGVIVCPNAVVSANAFVGAHAILNIGTCIGHDAEVGNYTTFSSHCDITGRVKIGRRCFFGSSAGALPRVVIGDDCSIGAGAIAVRNLQSGMRLYQAPPLSLPPRDLRV